jgi:hypothetical protein
VGGPRLPELALLAFDGSPGGGEDNLPHTVLDPDLEEADGAEYVDVGVEVRLPHRASDVHLGCLVAERLGSELLEDLGASTRRTSAS